MGLSDDPRYHDARMPETPAQVSANMRDTIDDLRRQLAAANERAGRLQGALRSLVNDVSANAGAFEEDVREAVGNINYACLMDKVEQARKALEVPDAM